MSIHDAGDLVGDRYEIGIFVGEGGMQEVYSAYDQLLFRNVALKTPKTSSATKRFKRSAETSAKINHHNVAKTLDYLEDDGRYYLIEELIDGCDLGVFLREYVPRLDPYACARVMHHLAKGLAASHHAGVIHRDLKPTNIMVVGGADFVELKITDFGIAKMAEAEMENAVAGGDEEALTQSATALGALPYMAPEFIESFKHAGKPADVWSLGALMFELLTGSKPFGIGYRAVPAIQAAVPPALPPGLLLRPQFSTQVQELYAIVLQCLKKDPVARPTADQLVVLCETLCYSDDRRYFGKVKRLNHRDSGFLSGAPDGDTFFHMQSVFSETRLEEEAPVWFSRHPGMPSPRAFPVAVAHAPRAKKKRP